MKSQIAILALGLSVSALPVAALAGDAYVTASVNLRSGPDSSYPTVARLRAGSAVSLDGCVDGWAWCDVSNGDDRGWVSGAFLQQEYEGERLGIRSYGSRIGIPIISFEFGSYWNDHYRNRPWFERREHWSHVRPQYRAIEEHRGSRDRDRDRDRHDSHERAREDSHNYTHGDTRGSARSGDDPMPRNRAANVPVPSRAANERTTEQDVERRNATVRGSPAPVAVAARPAGHVQSVPPTQNGNVAPRAVEPSAKTREQERDDKDRH